MIESEGIELRRAQHDDADLIRRIVCLAATWRDAVAPFQPPSGLDAYHEEWMRADDVGVVVFTGIEFVGGAYARRVGPADGTYGYVSSELWELTIGIEHSRRRQGIGRLALESLKATTLQRGIEGLSLSVERDNPARTLYTASGFRVVEERESNVLMSWTLR